MAEFHVEVRVTPREGLLDPQGKAVHGALHSLAFAEVEEVRVGRHIALKLQGPSESEVRARVEAMCQKLLANPVTEDYSIEVTS